VFIGSAAQLSMSTALCAQNADLDVVAPYSGSLRPVPGAHQQQHQHNWQQQQQQAQHQLQQQQQQPQAEAVSAQQQPPVAHHIGTKVAGSDPIALSGSGNITALCPVGAGVAIGTSTGQVRIWKRGSSFHLKSNIAKSIKLRELDPVKKHSPACSFMGLRTVQDDKIPPVTSDAANGAFTIEIGTPFKSVKVKVGEFSYLPVQLSTQEIISLCSIPHTKATEPALASCSIDGIIMVWRDNGIIHMVTKVIDDITAGIGTNTHIIATRNSKMQLIIAICCGDNLQIWNLGATGGAINSYSWKPSKCACHYHACFLNLLATPAAITN
jgi:hypothetical protein